MYDINNPVEKTEDRLLADSHLNAGRVDEAVQVLKRMVDNGESIAYCYLGDMYERGLSTSENSQECALEKNEEYALFYYEKAIEHGWLMGFIGLGRMYYLGLGVERSYEVSKMYFDKLAESGSYNTIADYFCGLMFEMGHGVEMDYSRAAFLFERSWHTGYVQSGLRLAIIHKKRKNYLRSLRLRLYLPFFVFSTVRREGDATWKMEDPRTAMGRILPLVSDSAFSDN